MFYKIYRFWKINRFLVHFIVKKFDEVKRYLRGNKSLTSLKICSSYYR